MKHFCRFLLLVCLGSFNCGLILPAANAATIPNEITKTVVFIYRNIDGSPEHADGTGFLVAIPVPGHPDHNWTYLVTAKHVIHTDPNNFNSPIYPQLFVRANKKSGGSIMVSINLALTGAGQTAYEDADDSVDIVVIPIRIDDIASYDVLALPEDYLATTDDLAKLKFGIGTDMFFTGMFAPYQGVARNYPIVRFGKLSMVPEEKIRFGNTLIDAYLVETFSFGGNSGSPVFFYPSSDNVPGVLHVGPRPLKVAGVMKGFFGDVEPIVMATPSTSSSQAVPVSQSNSGIAVVVPAKYIREILHSPALEEMRSKGLAELNRGVTH